MKRAFLSHRIDFLSPADARANHDKYKTLLVGFDVEIISVADTLDAITSDRPYRPAQSLAAARDEIKLWSGRQFDPDVVKVFLEMDQNIWPDLRKEVNAQVQRFAYSTSAKSSS